MSCSEQFSQALKSGTQLQQYSIKEVLGQGGFGITYIAEDTRLRQLVAIKEFLPEELALRGEGNTVQSRSTLHRKDFLHFKARFLDEARILARFRHPNIVRIQNYFEENGTAYLVMEYEDGQSLETYVRRFGATLPQKKIVNILLPLLDGLEVLHASGMIHRDIKPSNIFIRKDNSPVLLDFGAAREAMGGQNKSLTYILTPGYAPMEQYYTEAKRQGPWTDIYALAAVIYHIVTGQKPVEANLRSAEMLRNKTDPLPPLETLGKDQYSSHFLQTINKALMILPDDRPANINIWRQALLSDEEMPKTNGQKPLLDRNASTIRNTVHSSVGFNFLVAPVAILLGCITGTLAGGELFQAMDWHLPFEYMNPRYNGQIVSAALVSMTITLFLYLNSSVTVPRIILWGVLFTGTVCLFIGIQLSGILTQYIASTNLFTITTAGLKYLFVTLCLTLALIFQFLFRDHTILPSSTTLYVLLSLAGIAFGLLGVLFVGISNKNQLIYNSSHLSTSPDNSKAAMKRFEEDTVISLAESKHEITEPVLDAAPPKTNQNTYTLSVDTIPSNARVRILNIETQYYPGIRLPPGRYHVEVAKPGYAKHREWIKLDEAGQIVVISLRKGLITSEFNHTYRDSLEGGSLGPEMVQISGGCFQMGSPTTERGRANDERWHRVCVKSFAIGKYEVTFKEYDQFSEASNREKVDDLDWGRGNHPVIDVSWNDAMDYANWLSRETGHRYRLPTEAEWEYAARGGTQTAYWWGEEIGDNLTNCDGCGSRWDGQKASPIGSFQANQFGLFDVTGNVWEWVCTHYQKNYDGTEKLCQDKHHANQRVIRGGSWLDSPKNVRLATRLKHQIGMRNTTLGFRLARD